MKILDRLIHICLEYLKYLNKFYIQYGHLVRKYYLYGLVIGVGLGSTLCFLLTTHPIFLETKFYPNSDEYVMYIWIIVYIIALLAPMFIVVKEYNRRHDVRLEDEELKEQVRMDVAGFVTILYLPEMIGLFYISMMLSPEPRSVSLAFILFLIIISLFASFLIPKVEKCEDENSYFFMFCGVFIGGLWGPIIYAFIGPILLLIPVIYIVIKLLQKEKDYYLSSIVNSLRFKIKIK